MSKATARNVTVGLVGLLLLLAWGQADAQLPAASAEVVRVAGQVSVLPKGQQAWVPAAVGARLVEGDQIRALAASSADLNLPDGSTILVAENTRFAVTKLEYDPQTRDRNASFYVVAGKVRAQVSSAAVQLARQRQSNFTISTPSGVAAVRGTVVTILTRSATQATPAETIVLVEPSAGQSASAARVNFISRNGQQVVLTGGTFSRVVGTGTPSPATPISNLAPAARAAIAGTANSNTQNDPSLAGFAVTIINVNQDLTLVQTATGITVVGPQETVTVGTTTTTTPSTIGREILNLTPPTCATPPC